MDRPTERPRSAADVARAARAIYPTGSWTRRQMMYARPYICPFETLIEKVPDGASVLDVGCGDGLFLNLLCYYGLVSGGAGFDTNAAAIANAEHARSALAGGQNLSFTRWSVGQPWPDETYGVVSMIDVLHHIPVAGKKPAIEAAAARVGPGGVLLFKDIGPTPRWRAFANSLHDFVLTQERVTYTPIDTIVRWAEACGLSLKDRTTINRLWYGHELLVFTR